MRVRFPTTALIAISILMVGSLRFIRAATTPSGRATDESSRAPVLIELFTSEGCSSCPPADALLQRFDRSQPVNGAELIVLSEHVDYWNNIGWTDPYSSHEYSERQSAYATQFGLGSIYTPQMVVDGQFELVGSDERRATQAIRDAAKRRKAPVSVSISARSDKTVTVHVEAGPLPSSIDTHAAGVFLAIADNADESHVSNGENAGRTLQHVAVLRKLVRIGAVDRSGAFSHDITVDLNSTNGRDLRMVAIVQEAEAGRVLGAGFVRLLN